MSNMTSVREALNLMSQDEIQNLYSTINNKGRGFSVGSDEVAEDLRAAAKEDEFTVWHSIGQGREEILCASNDIGECFLIGNAHGAYAVPIEESDISE